MIVEDEALIATNLEILLEGAGCTVIGWATESREAREIAESGRPEIAIVDIQLRDGDDGILLAAELHEMGIEVIFVTAQSDSATISRARAVPHRAYVTKPYTMQRILAALPPGKAG